MNDDGIRYTGESGADTDSPDDTVSGTAVTVPGVSLAFLTYAFLLFLRVSGLAGLFRYAHPRNPLAAPPLRDVGEFVFFDSIVLAAIGLACSGVLLALVIASSRRSDYRYAKLTAATGVGLPALVYVVGSILVVAR